ncbi:bacterio-opsin activator domain-containing protein [Natrinema limicola]|uniref:PAS sensor protein n=1 Tax=Natrinema limicola JCM 13563 TaxID=1230457 RepID=M0CD65_9EURY|nr:bacterio-opsin activator domain-containing protein [Natrinema limicola]ELZ21190.1 PAS sensor protein [Natrinema limicola JCM 13563]
MSERTATVVGDTPCVLVVGDDAAADDARDVLAARFAGASILRERTFEGAHKRLADRDVHCLVCPFDAAAVDRLGGESTLERLAADADERPIVAITDEGDADDALAAGASDVVARDESPRVLTARVRTAAEREQYRLAAAASDRRQRSILEHAAAVVWVLDADGEIEYATPAVESELGYTPAELERTPIDRLVHPDDREAIHETLAAVTDAPVGATERVTLRLGDADGTWRVSEVTCANRLADPTVEGVVMTRTGVGAAADVAAPAALHAGVDRLEDAFFVLGPQDELQYANDAATTLFRPEVRQIDLADVSGTVVWDLLPDEISEALFDRVRAAESTGAVETVSVTAPSLEGRLAVRVHPSDDGVSVYATDQSVDAAAAPDLERLELLETVIDALDDGIAVLEGSTIRLANPALRELADADTLVGHELETVFDADLVSAIRTRARSPVVRWMEPVSGTLATDEAPPVDVFVVPLSMPDRTLCVVRDRRESRAATLSTVHDTVAAIRRAETPSAVRDAATDAIREHAGADVAVWYRLADDRLQPAAIAAAEHVGGDRHSIEPPPIDLDDTPLAATVEDEAATVSPTVYERAELDAVLAQTGLRAERGLSVPITTRAVVLATSTDPMAFDGLESDPIEMVSDAAAVALESLERADSLRTCRHDRSRLETTAAQTERVWDAGGAMLTAETRDAVEQRLCEAVFALSSPETPDAITLAWIGHADHGRETVVPTTWAGRDGEFLESATVPMGADADTPTGTAAATGELVVDDLSSDRETHDDGRSWRRQLLERGIQSVLSVALTADGVRYGTLTAYASEPSAFDEHVQRACQHLAAIAGAAIGSIETKRALLADRITELEVVLRDDTEPLSTIASQLEQRLTVRAIVPRTSGGSTAFCTVEGGVDDTVCDAVESLPAVDSISIVERGDDGVLEIGVTAPTVAETIADHGGVLRSLTPVDDRTRLVIELGEPVDVRSFVQHLERRHPGTELVARRQRDRPLRPPRPFDELHDHLSDRQRRTLEAAYYGGFFEWPREHTGEEVAESLGVSQPTFSRHLRLAQGKLFALLFDEPTRD